MATIKYTSPDGTVVRIKVPDGVDPAQAVAEFEAANGISQPAEAPSPASPRLGLTGMVERAAPGFFDSAERGAGLAARNTVAAVPKAATGVTDLAASVLNIIPETLARADAALSGREPPAEAPGALPTNNTAFLDELLNEVFPEPDTMLERIGSTGSEIALTGGIAGAGLAPKAASVAKNPAAQGITRNLLDDIGEFFAKSPAKATAVETGGGLGAATGSELAQEAELGPAGQVGATFGGGIAGGVTPMGATNILRKGAAGVVNKLDSAFAGDLRAARAVQSAAENPEAAAKAALDAPEGVSAARATEDPGLMAMESRVLADNPPLQAKVQKDLDIAEDRTRDELASQFGPKTDKAAWQQEVIVQGAPDSASIKVGPPDEMLDDAARSFGAAYDEAAGYPIRLENVQVAGGDVPLRELFRAATSNRAIRATPKMRKNMQSFLDGLLDDLSVGRKTEDGVAEVPSQSLLRARTLIRDELRVASKSNKAKGRADAQMLRAANDALTTVLESQLPEKAAAALRATDTRYRQFLTVQDAVVRSGEAGLTPDALRAAVKAANTKGDLARGRTGELGRLATTGRDVAKTLGKPDEAARLTRDMTPEQLQQAKADFNAAIAKKATPPSTGALNGDKYLKQININESTLKAAGFTDTDLSQMRTVGRQLRMIQARQPAAVKALLEDDVGSVMRLMGAIAGSKFGSRVLGLTGGATGAGPSLIVSQFGSRMMQKRLTELSVDKADEMIRAAATDKELFAALLTKPTDSLKKQADAARTIQAWLTRSAPEDTEEE